MTYQLDNALITPLQAALYQGFMMQFCIHEIDGHGFQSYFLGSVTLIFADDRSLQNIVGFDGWETVVGTVCPTLISEIEGYVEGDRFV